MRETKILFIAPANATFCQKDEKILRNNYEVRTINYSWNDKGSLLSLPLKVFLGTLWCDLTFSWFGSFHAFLAVLFSKIFRKKSLIIAGGNDVVNIPKIRYGLLNNKLWKYFAVFSFKLCDKILAVSQYTKREAIENLKLNPDKIDVIYHGFDAGKFYPKGEKEKIVLTISTRINEVFARRKGLRTFINTSRLIPDINFLIVGKPKKEFIKKLNLRHNEMKNLLGYLSNDELLSHFQKAKIYIQISYHEGFGCAIAEAMLCECIPIVTDRGAIPEVVGNCGYYVHYGDDEETSMAIREALIDKVTGKRARQRIKEKFPLKKREKRIIKIIEDMMSL